MRNAADITPIPCLSFPSKNAGPLPSSHLSPSGPSPAAPRTDAKKRDGIHLEAQREIQREQCTWFMVCISQLSFPCHGKRAASSQDVLWRVVLMRAFFEGDNLGCFAAVQQTDGDDCDAPRTRLKLVYWKRSGISGLLLLKKKTENTSGGGSVGFNTNATVDAMLQ